MYTCMYDVVYICLMSPPRLLIRIQPNFTCPLEVTMAPYKKYKNRLPRFW